MKRRLLTGGRYYRQQHWDLPVTQSGVRNGELGKQEWGSAYKRLIMRVTITCFLLTTTLVYGFAGNLMAQRVTIDKTDAAFSEVIRELRRQSGYDFLVDKELARKAGRISIRATDEPLREVLDKVVAHQRLTFTIMDDIKSVVIKEAATPSRLNRHPERSAAESNGSLLILAFPEVRGKIVDSLGQPLSGASVRVLDAQGQRTSLQTQTDRNGEFLLRNVPEDAILEISYIGYVGQQVKASGNVGVIVLKELSSALEEVEINKGYYTTKRELNTGSVGVITAEEIARQPVGDPLLTLHGRIPGLYVAQQSGYPGQSVSVQIRGRNSIANGVDPLYVINGVPFPSVPLNSRSFASRVGLQNPLNSISAADIENITVLKDADATAIYGSMGANGVILITTKKGQAGQTTVDAKVDAGWSEVGHKMEFMNTQQYLEMRQEALKNDGRTTFFPFEHDINGNWDQNKYTDWQEVFLGGTAGFKNADLRLSGGSELTNFILGANYRKDNALFSSKFYDQKLSLSSSVSHHSKKQRFKAYYATSFNRNKNLMPPFDLMQFVAIAPNAPDLYDSHGNLNWQNGTFTNPLGTTKREAVAVTDNFLTDGSLGFQLLPGLSIENSFGFNYLRMKENQITPSSASGPLFENDPNRRRHGFADNKIISWILEPKINFNRTFWDKADVQVLLGSTFREIANDQLSQTAQNFASDELIYNVAAAGSKTIDSYTNSLYRYNAFYGRIGVNWEDKYILNLTGRRDGSSNFGADNKFGNFGAIGAAWILSQEDFLESLSPVVSFAKLRGSYGVTGNDQLPAYQYLSTFSSLNYVYSGNSSLFPSRLNNPDLAWEEVKKAEGALELGFFANRLNIVASYYQNTTGNSLVRYPLSRVTGFVDIQANLPAIIRNQGFEFEYTLDVLDKGNFKWSSSGNISFQRNRLVSYPDFETSSYAIQYALGKSMFGSYVFRYTGIDPTTGLYTVEDLNKDNLIGYNTDRFYLEREIGSYGGLNNDFSYRQWSVSIFLQFVTGNWGRNFVKNGAVVGQANANQPLAALDRWEMPGDVGKLLQKYSTNYYQSNEYFDSSDAHLERFSFGRLKNISVNYSVPSRFLTPLNIQAARIYLQGQNLYTLTNYIGYDPETPTGNLSLPPLRTISAGIQLTL